MLAMVVPLHQQQPLNLSSSGGLVSTTLSDYYEVQMKDHDGTFSWFGNQWSNGMCRARFNDDPNCAVFAWDERAEINFEISDNF
jgi:hypothetical protein